MSTHPNNLNTILTELYQVSNDRDLFARERARNPSQITDTTTTAAPTSMSHAENAAFVQRIRVGFEKLLAATTGEEAMQIIYPELTRAYERDTRETVLKYQEVLLGECTLLYTCLTDDTPCRPALRDEILRRIEKSEMRSRAAREWITLMINVLQHEVDEESTRVAGFPYMEKLHMMKLQRASLTCSLFQNRPGLVGEAFVEYGKSCEEIGTPETLAQAKQCYQSVTMDLNYLDTHQNMPPGLRWELMAIFYYFEQACSGLLRLNPNDATAQQKLEKVQALRRAEDYPDALSMPQVGPILETYLDRTPYLFRLLSHIQNEEWTFVLAHRYDYCKEIDFYRSAMGSYFSARPLLQSMGVMATYDAAHHEVFEALDYAQTGQQASSG